MDNKKMENDTNNSFVGKQTNGKQKWKTNKTKNNTIYLQVK